MFVSTSIALLTALAATQVSAQASTTDLSLENQGWVNSGFALKTLAGFGLDLNASAVLTVNYAGGAGLIENGKDYTTAQVATLPTISFEPAASATTLGTGRAYTVVLADASSLGDPDKAGNYRHYLANGANATANGTDTFRVSGGTVVTSYAGPGPLTGSGTHRYAWMLFLQGTSFKAPTNLSTAGTAASHWNVSSYVTSAGGLQLIAASFFTVTASGTPTGAVITTSAATTPASTTTATATKSGSAAPNATSTAGTVTASSSGASTTTATAPSGSEKLVVTSLLGATLGMVALFALI